MSKVWYWGTWLGAREMQAVCMKVVTSSSVASPKFFWEGQILWLEASNSILFGHCLSKHRMTRYVRNLGGMVPLPPSLRLWLQEKNEKERRVLSWCSIFQTKKLTTTQDSQALQNSDEKQYCQYWMLRLVVINYIARKQRMLVETLYAYVR